MYKRFVFLSLIMIPLLMLFSLLIGSSSISWKVLWEGLLLKNHQSSQLIYQFRFPRILLVPLVGACLAVSGFLMQTISQNRLVSPSMVGIVDGALMGIVLAKFLKISLPFSTQVASIIGALLTVALVYSLAAVIPGGFVKTRFVLLGLLISNTIGAVATLFSIQLSFFQNSSLFFLGTVSDAKWWDVLLLLSAIGLCLPALVYVLSQLDGFHLGDDILHGLGKPVMRIKISAIVVATVLSAVSISLVGKINFMGLIVPNMVAAFALSSPQKQFVLNVLISMNLMLAADILSKLLRYPYETPIAFVISLLGIPFFFYIIKKQGGSHA